MSDIKQPIILSGGLNLDKDPLLLGEGESNYRLNCEISTLGHEGICLNTKGNELITYTLPAGINTVIGSKFYEYDNSLIYFVHNSNNLHSIIKYNISLNTFNKILYSSTVLNFNLAYKIHSIDIIDGWIYWTDGYNEPRHINIERAIRYTEKEGAVYTGVMSTYSSTSLQIVIPSYTVVIDGVFTAVLPIEINDIIYIDCANNYSGFYKVYSVTGTKILVYCPYNLGSISGTVTKIDGDSYFHITEEELNIIRKPPTYRPLAFTYNDTSSGVKALRLGTYRFIYKYVYNDYTESIWSHVSKNIIPYYTSYISGSLTMFHNSISICIDNGSNEVKYIKIAFSYNDGDWKYIDKYEREIRNGLQVIDFSDGGLYETVVLEEALKSFDNIPISSNSLISLPGTYLSLIGNNYTYTLNNIESDVALSSYSSPYHGVFRYEFTAITPGGANITYGNTYTYNSDKNEYEHQRYFNYELQLPSYYSFIYVVITIGSVTYQLGRSVAYTTVTTAVLNLAIKDILLELQDLGSFIGTTFYFNKTINNDFFSDFSISIKFANTVPSRAVELITYSNAIIGDCIGDIPLAICYYDNYHRNSGLLDIGTSSIALSTTVKNIELLINHNAPEWATSYQLYAKNLYLKLYSTVATISDSDFSATLSYEFTNMLYSYSEGDYIWISSAWFKIKSTSTNSIIYFEQSPSLNYSGLYPVYIANFINTDQNYYAFTPIYKIINGMHYGSTQNQTVLQPALLRITSGITAAYYAISITQTVCIMAVHTKSSKDYDLNAFNLGKPNTTIENIFIGIKNSILNSNKYIKGTQQNGLCTFDWEEETNEFNTLYGNVTDMQLNGDNVYVIQPRKCHNIYVNKASVTYQDGTTNLITIEQLLGKPIEYNTSFGTIFKTSVCQSFNAVYAFDIYNKIIFQINGQGQKDISIGIKLLLDQLSTNILRDGIENCNVISYFDFINSNLYFTFINNVTPTDNTTIVYNEKYGYWYSYASFIPEMYSTNVSMYTFKNGALYKHNSDTSDRCTFYEVKYDQELNVIVNIEPLKIKLFDSLNIASNKKWDIECNIEPDGTYIRGMYSIIPQARQINKEGAYYAEFLRNMKTKSSSKSPYYLYNGDRLRGKKMIISMNNSEDDEVLLSNIDVKCSLSAGTNI